MPYLANTSELPSNAEWSYLYAIADVYSNYSSPSFSTMNPDAPHPLTDTEVIQILNTRYNLKNVHRNTVANIRARLEKYFGFEFKTKGKGKFIYSQNTGFKNEQMLLMICFIIKECPFITDENTDEFIKCLYSLVSSVDLKKEIELIANKRMPKCYKDNLNSFNILSKAITNEKTIIMHSEVFLKPQKIKPFEIFCLKNNKVELFLKYDLVDCPSYYNIHKTIPLNKIRKIDIL